MGTCLAGFLWAFIFVGCRGIRAQDAIELGLVSAAAGVGKSNMRNHSCNPLGFHTKLRHLSDLVSLKVTIHSRGSECTIPE